MGQSDESPHIRRDHSFVVRLFLYGSRCYLSRWGDQVSEVYQPKAMRAVQNMEREIAEVLREQGTNAIAKQAAIVDKRLSLPTPTMWRKADD